MEINTTGSILGTTNRRLSSQKKRPKRVSFKDETLVIPIPSREASTPIWRYSDAFNTVTVHSYDNSENTPTRQTDLEAFSTACFFGNGAQKSPATTMVNRSSSLTERVKETPSKSALKTFSSSATLTQRKSYLDKSYRPVTRREIGKVTSRSLDNLNTFLKQGFSVSSHNTFVKSSLERPTLGGTTPARPTSVSRGLHRENSQLNHKTRRFLSLEFPFNRISSDVDFHSGDKTRTTSFGDQPHLNLDIVGVTCEGVNKKPYFHDTSDVDRSWKYSPVTNRRNDRGVLRHSSVSTASQFNALESTKGPRHLSAVPGFYKNSPDTREFSALTWKSSNDSFSKRQLPVAWQTDQRYNYSTK